MNGSKMVKLQLLLPFFCVLFIHCLAILLFTRGFLLTRTELPHFSNCSDVSHSPCFSSNATCWTQPSVDRIIILVFDALRFDFVAPSTFFEEKKPWMDKLDMFQKLAAEPGLSARIFKAIADPPTTSLQRLKGLTTGGLPTFIDVGNSFGAPAIVEDNLIRQLVRNGKRVVMMGDDTWLQLFPHHFEKSFPYPSFNVKDLDTVDNGCIQHLLPSLDEGNWDVLIAHFLGVDHAGHIFGVNTEPMMLKLKQYNSIVEKVVDALRNSSGPGGPHENTFLLVMGDHGQTLNGDHGGGSPEEVETSVFAMSFKNFSFSLPSELDTTSCGLNMDGRRICISTVEQIDFAATMSALLGVPFPFGSIGRVNPLLYSLAAGGSILEHTARKGDRNYSYQEWMRHYVSVLCMNVWQVKRYIDVYSASSVIGFPSEDLLHVEDIYSQAQQNWLHIMNKSLSCKGVSCGVSLPELEGQVEAYLKFLGSVIELARSKWTEFNLKLMVVGLSILFMSLFVQLAAIKRTNKFIRSSLTTGHLQASVRFALFVVVMRACSFLSNSYILEEGKVAIFFLGTTAILGVRQSIITKRTLSEATLLLLLVCAFRFTMEFGLSKQVTVLFDEAGIFGIAQDHPFWIYLSSIMTMLVMFSLAYILHKFSSDKTGRGVQKYVILGTVFCYILIATYYGLEGELFSLPLGFQNVTRKYIPWSIYAIGILQLVSLALGEVFHAEKSVHYQKGLTLKMVAMLCTWSSTIILLLGKQGAMVALATIGAAWCIVRLGNVEQAVKKGRSSYLTLYPLPITQWSLLAVALFFCTGHWCAFDGLRYGAAFVGFDEFVLVRQAILLTIDTFGFSHILPVFGLPILVSQCFPSNNMQHSKLFTSVQLSQVYLMYGFVTAIGVAFTVLCVTIHRRHLMVWGLFAPKYVFDVVGLILTDVLICVASVYYIDPVEDDNTVMRN